MPFFDELGQKTKNATETVKLNNQISGGEKKVRALTEELGKACFELYKDAPPPELAALIAKIQEEQRMIDEYTEQVKRLKGIASCPRCGADVRIDAAFCNGCGNPMQSAPAPTPTPTPEEERPAFCSQCGAALAGGTAFCSACGAKV
ncbi:MAG: zinc ribbon domain-containing protein [Clostridiales bacterium]|nr:zinc ribbon domain-containing protein [Clostridiales bacterium]